MATRVTIYDEAIASAFWPGEMAWRGTRRVGDLHARYARQDAPHRTGRLGKSIYMVVTPYGRFRCRYTVATKVEYASYTITGTQGPIFPKKSLFLFVRPRPFSYYSKTTLRMSVRGQRGHDWLESSRQRAWLDSGI